jgi:hypothetical protein
MTDVMTKTMTDFVTKTAEVTKLSTVVSEHDVTVTKPVTDFVRLFTRSRAAHN